MRPAKQGYLRAARVGLGGLQQRRLCVDPAGNRSVYGAPIKRRLR